MPLCLFAASRYSLVPLPGLVVTATWLAIQRLRRWAHWLPSLLWFPFVGLLRTRGPVWGTSRAFSIYQEIPENSANFVGKCLSGKDAFHLTHSSHSSQAPFTVRCISRQNTKWRHNCYARLLFGRRVSRDVNSDDDDIPFLAAVATYMRLHLTHKTLNELAPDYLQCLFTQRHVNDYNLRNFEGKLSLPKPSTNYLKRSFCSSGACLWNNLPQDLKNVCSIGQFKRGIKKVSEISDSHTAIM